MSQLNENSSSAHKSVLQSEYTDFQDAFFKQFVRPFQRICGQTPTNEVVTKKPQEATAPIPPLLKEEKIEKVD